MRCQNAYCKRPAEHRVSYDRWDSWGNAGYDERGAPMCAPCLEELEHEAEVLSSDKAGVVVLSVGEL